MRHWAAFRAIACGESIQEPDEAELVSAVVEGSDALIDGNLERFELSKDGDELFEILDQSFSGRILVGLFTGFESTDGELLAAFASPWKTLIAAFPPDLAERDSAILLREDGAAAANVMRYVGDGVNVVWLKLAERRHGMWRDAFSTEG